MRLAGALNVARARVRGGSLADRAPLEAALAQVALDRLGLSPRAVLYVPRLAPRRALRRRDPAGFAGACGQALAGEARAAVRCRPGETSGGGSLLFDSEADFLAWLIHGWLRGAPGPSAALAGLAGARGTAAFLAQEVLGRGEMVPALFERLARAGTLAGLLQVMSDEALCRSFTAVARAHGLPAMLAVCGTADGVRQAVAGAVQRPGSHVEAGVRLDPMPPAGSHVQALFADALDPMLPAEAQALAILALGLARAPVWVRSKAAEALIERTMRGETAREVHTSGHFSDPLVATGHTARKLAQDIDIQRYYSNIPYTERHPSDASPSPSPAVIAETIRSEFGGLLFLLPMLLDLGLYADFARPLGSNLALSPWLLLRRIGRRWFARRFATDPLDQLLAHLAGLPPDAPHGRAPRGLRMGEIDARLRAELTRRTGHTPRAAIDLLRRPATLWPGDGALDAEFALEGHPLALRLAGLDRDPGWIPAAGRAVAFHFR